MRIIGLPQLRPSSITSRSTSSRTLSTGLGCNCITSMNARGTFAYMHPPCSACSCIIPTPSLELLSAQDVRAFTDEVGCSCRGKCKAFKRLLWA